MKEGLRDWITDAFAVLIWLGASYKEFFTDTPFGIWTYLGIMALGLVMLGLSIKQISAKISLLIDKISKKKLG